MALSLSVLSLSALSLSALSFPAWECLELKKGYMTF